jgi:hypothetical protein
MKRTSLAAVGIAALGAAVLVGDSSVRAGAAEDDLAVVRRAVAQATTPAPQPLQEEARPAPRPGAKPLWLRVRVTERGGKRVRMNLPLSLVRAVGDWPIDFGCGRHGDRRCTLSIGEVLNALDAGQSLIEVDDDDGTKVRIWVE